MEYLNTHEFVTNKIVRTLTGGSSKNKVKKAFQRLRRQGAIEPIDPNASPFAFKYRKVIKKKGASKK